MYELAGIHAYIRLVRVIARMSATERPVCSCELGGELTGYRESSPDVMYELADIYAYIRLGRVIARISRASSVASSRDIARARQMSYPSSLIFTRTYASSA